MPLDAIEPVLSSASARLSFLMPQSTSRMAAKLDLDCPSSLANIGLTVPLPVILRMKLPCLRGAELRRDLDVLRFRAGEIALK